MSQVDLARDREGHPWREVDVCIVGAGPAGLSLARRLSNTQLSIVVLEAGPTKQEGPEAEGIHTGLPYEIDETRSFGTGGTAQRWFVDTPHGPGHVRLRELDPGDVDGRAWIGEEPWPISHEELSKWYPSARSLCGISEYPPPWTSDPVVTATDHQLELSLFEFAHRSVFTETIPRWLQRQPRVEIVNRAKALGIVGGGVPFEATGVRIHLLDTDEMVSLRAKVVILCAGAAENARLLLQPISDDTSELGNASGQVGVGFMEHPNYIGGILVPSPSWLRSAGARTRFEHLSGRLIERRYVLSDSLQERFGLLRNHIRLSRSTMPRRAVAALLAGAPASPALPAARRLLTALRAGRATELPSALGSIIGHAPSLARYTSSVTRYRVSHRHEELPREVFVLVSSSEQRRHPSSRVILGAPGRDGTRAVSIHLELTEPDLESMERWSQVLATVFEDAGVGRLVDLFDRSQAPSSLGWGHHHLGTTVMSKRPEEGVVDRDGRVHGTGNVYVCSSSVFPTGGYANPTLTIIALACRLADHLRRRLEGRATPVAPEV